jgi:hypothetical protein
MRLAGRVKRHGSSGNINETGWQGKTAERVIQPRPQWILEAYCLSRKSFRMFTLKDITLWKDVTNDQLGSN